jgi:hypothetical protein
MEWSAEINRGSLRTRSWMSGRARERCQAREWRSVATTRRRPWAWAWKRIGRRGCSSWSSSGWASPKTAGISTAAVIYDNSTPCSLEDVKTQNYALLARPVFDGVKIIFKKQEKDGRRRGQGLVGGCAAAAGGGGAAQPSRSHGGGGWILRRVRAPGHPRPGRPPRNPPLPLHRPLPAPRQRPLLSLIRFLHGSIKLN